MSGQPQPSREALAGLHDSAYRWALVCCDFDAERAREVMQMVYLEILRGSAVFHGRSSLRTWLFAVVRRTALKALAGQRRAERLRLHLARFVGAGPEAAFANGAGDPPSGLTGGLDGALCLHRDETRRTVLAAVQDLSPRQRQIVDLVYYHDLTVAEAAAVLGLSAGAAARHFHRAKRALAAALAPHREELARD